MRVVYIKRTSAKVGEAGSLTTQMYLHWSSNNENIAHVKSNDQIRKYKERRGFGGDLLAAFSSECVLVKLRH